MKNQSQIHVKSPNYQFIYTILDKFLIQIESYIAVDYCLIQIESKINEMQWHYFCIYNFIWLIKEKIH